MTMMTCPSFCACRCRRRRRRWLSFPTKRSFCGSIAQQQCGSRALVCHQAEGGRGGRRESTTRIPLSLQRGIHKYIQTRLQSEVTLIYLAHPRWIPLTFDFILNTAQLLLFVDVS